MASRSGTTEPYVAAWQSPRRNSCGRNDVVAVMSPETKNWNDNIIKEFRANPKKFLTITVKFW
jgi:hypothetical protein